jgi:hypothetical protein
MKMMHPSYFVLTYHVLALTRDYDHVQHNFWYQVGLSTARREEDAPVHRDDRNRRPGGVLVTARRSLKKTMIRPNMQNTAWNPEWYQRNGSQSAGTKHDSTMVIIRSKSSTPQTHSIRIQSGRTSEGCLDNALKIECDQSRR